MNLVILVGKICNDIFTDESNGHRYARVNVSVNRQFKNQEGKLISDSYSVTFFEFAASFVNGLYKKGDLVSIRGHFQLTSYNAEDKKKRNIEIIGDKITLIPTDISNPEVEYESEEPV